MADLHKFCNLRDIMAENPESIEAQAERVRLTRLALMRDWGIDSEKVFCARVHIGQNTWRFYERGRGLPVPVALRFAREYRIPITWFYQGDKTDLPRYLIERMREVEEEEFELSKDPDKKPMKAR